MKSDQSASRNAQLLNALIVAMLLFGIVGTIFPITSGVVAPDEAGEYYILIVVGVILTAAMPLINRRFGYEVTARVWIAVTIIAVVYITYPGGDEVELNNLPYMLIPVVLTNIFLDSRATLIVTGIGLLSMMAVWVFAPNVDLGALVGGPGALYLIVAALILVARRHHDLLEIERQNRLVAAEKLQAALNRQHEINEMRSHLMRTVSHEFRTPLTVIRTSSDLLLHYNARMTEQQRSDHFERIFEQVDHLTEMIEEITTITRLQTGSVPIEAQLLNMGAFCAALIDEYRRIAPSHIFTLSLKNPAADLTDIYADKRLLRTILDNLIGNAAKYSPPKSEVALGLAREADTLIFQVSDQGSGIAPEDRARLFDSFFRGKNVGDQPGSGLGLKLVQDCVRLYKGTITFESVVGQGTTFTAYLPVLPAPTFSVGQTADSDTPSEPSLMFKVIDA